ncbi:MAG: TetR/AcrR family transcriptional regulator [Eubacteriales bacterium]|nr:TetR/AcrR family transcriptional regulator [Eubacteriales bacterium]
MSKTTEKKTDQRIRLTQSLLKNALVQLMQQQHISKISIRALCDVAGINRSTFYSHYSDQYDLLDKVEQEALDNVSMYLSKQDLDEQHPISVQMLTKVLDYVKDNIELFKALLSENCDYAFQKDLVELAQLLSMQQNQSLDAKTTDYLKTFCLSGTISMLQKWLHDGTVESPSQIAEFIIQLIYHGTNGLKKDIFKE